MNQFQYFINQMPHGKANTFRQMVVERCGITQAMFRLWRNGMKVSERHHDTINEIAMEMFGRKVFTEKGAEE